MDSLLYVYNIKNLELMQETLVEYRFASIAHFLNLSSSLDDIIEMNPSEVNNSIIDITNLIKDNNINMVFIERYLRLITDNFTDIHLSLQSDYLGGFRAMFPYFFSKDEIINDFNSPSTSISEGDRRLEISSPSSRVLYTYRNQETIRELYEKNSAISLAHLIQEGEGFVFKYDIENINEIIKEGKINYIDLSSLVKSLKLRSDLIFQFEILIYKIISINDVKYSIEESLRKEVLKTFPLLFIRKENIDYSIDEKEVEHEQQEVNIDQISLWVDQINERLRGHIIFKEDFHHNLLKFSYLNKMNDRKILSIFLCGESGIGKTEFSKIISNVMYPNEMLIKINFGNYSTEGVLNSLIGSPLGYVGSEEGGELINKIATSKSRIILIDEFERATPGVYNFFYELLEDGKFTDRHGIEHDLNGYIIVFTSNMTESQYHKHIPDSLKSRFDMVYYFEDLDEDEKLEFIEKTARRLIVNIKKELDYELELQSIISELKELLVYKNLREIKRKVEDIIFREFLKSMKRNGD